MTSDWLTLLHDLNHVLVECRDVLCTMAKQAVAVFISKADTHEMGLVEAQVDTRVDGKGTVTATNKSKTSIKPNCQCLSGV